MSRIGLFGGSFNPIHLGHTGLVKRMITAFSLDKVIVVPTYETPLKDNTPIVPSEHRINMCKLAFADLDNVIVSDIEIKRKGKSYTVDTLKQLKELYPEDEIFLIIGADSFLQLRLWYDVKSIFKLASILTVSRGEVLLPELNTAKKHYENEFNARVFISEEPICKLSSTEIRTAINNHKPFTHFLDEKVAEYIIENELYGYEK